MHIDIVRPSGRFAWNSFRTALACARRGSLVSRLLITIELSKHILIFRKLLRESLLSMNQQSRKLHKLPNADFASFWLKPSRCLKSSMKWKNSSARMDSGFLGFRRTVTPQSRVPRPAQSQPALVACVLHVPCSKATDLLGHGLFQHLSDHLPHRPIAQSLPRAHETST